MASISMTSPTMKCTCTASASRSGTKVTVSVKASGGGGASTSYTGYNVHVNVSCNGKSTTLTLNSAGNTWYTSNTKSKTGTLTFTDTSTTTSRSVKFVLYHNGSNKGSTTVTVSYAKYWTNASMSSASLQTSTSTISPDAEIKLNFTGASGTNNAIKSFQAYVRNASTGTQLGNVITVTNGGSYSPGNFGLDQWPAAINLNFAVRAIAAENTTSYKIASNSVYTDDIPVLSSWTYEPSDRYYQVINTIYKSPSSPNDPVADPSFTFIYNDSYYDASGVKLYVDGESQGTALTSGSTHTFSNIALPVGTHTIYASDGWVNSTTLTINVVESTISGTIQNNITDISNILYGTSSTYKGVETGNYIITPNTNCGIKEYKWDLKTGTAPNNLTTSCSSISTTSSCNFTFDYTKDYADDNKVYYQLSCTFKNNTNDTCTISSGIYIGPTNNSLGVDITYSTAVQLANDDCNENKFYDSKYYGGINYQYSYTNKNLGNSLINIDLGYDVNRTFYSKKNISGSNDNEYSIEYNLNSITPAIQITNLKTGKATLETSEDQFELYSFDDGLSVRNIIITPTTSETERYKPISGTGTAGTLEFDIIGGRQFFLAENTKIRISCQINNEIIYLFGNENGGILIDPEQYNKNIEVIKDNIHIQVSASDGIKIIYDQMEHRLIDYWFYGNNHGSENTETLYKSFMNDTIGKLDFTIDIIDGYGNIIYNGKVPLYYDCREQADLISGDYQVKCIYRDDYQSNITNDGISNCLFEGDKIQFTFPIEKDANDKYPIYYISYTNNDINEWKIYQKITIPIDAEAGNYTIPTPFPITQNTNLGTLQTLYFRIQAYDEVLNSEGKTTKYFRLDGDTDKGYNEPNICFYKPPYTSGFLSLTSSIDNIIKEGDLFNFDVSFDFTDFKTKFCYENNKYRLQRKTNSEEGLKCEREIYGFISYEDAEKFIEGTLTTTSEQKIHEDELYYDSTTSVTNSINDKKISCQTDKSTLFIIVKIKLTIAGTSNSLIITGISGINTLITAIPTISYRQNYLGINDNSFKNDDLLNILGLDLRKTIRMHTIDNKCIKIVGASIDCGTWDKQNL